MAVKSEGPIKTASGREKYVVIIRTISIAQYYVLRVAVVDIPTEPFAQV